MKQAIADSKYKAGIDYDRIETVIFNFLFEPYSEQNGIMIKKNFMKGFRKGGKLNKTNGEVCSSPLSADVFCIF